MKLQLLVLAPQLFNCALILFEEDSLLNVASQIAQNIVNSYIPSDTGAFTSEWFESGMCWWSLGQYVKETAKTAISPLIFNAISNASYGPSADFLGSPAIKVLSGQLGKWNDDILWWAMAPLQAAKIYGQNAIISNDGTTYIQIAVNTFNDVDAQWDMKCGGGVYWARDRAATNVQQATYKSAITNAQFMFVAIRLYSITQTKSYLDTFVKTYAWLQSSNIITADWTVVDGISSNDCIVSPQVFSYNTGMVMMALAEAYSATSTKTYLNDAISLMKSALLRYAPNNILQDDCDTKGCQTGALSFKLVLILGLKDLYRQADPATQTIIMTVIQKSIQGMAPTCDASYNCKRTWQVDGAATTTGFDAEMIALALVTTAVSIVAPKLGMITQTSPTTVKVASSGLRHISFIHTSRICAWTALSLLALL